MPIRKELRHHYGKQWHEETRPAALDRAGHECQHCAKPNHAMIETVTHVVAEEPRRYEMYWRSVTIHPSITYMPGAAWIHKDGRPLYYAEPDRGRLKRYVYVVLTIAHLNNIAGDDRPENLRALCQWCHLIYDLEHHHHTRGSRKDKERPLLAAIAS